jgi:hypothetical protein
VRENRVVAEAVNGAVSTALFWALCKFGDVDDAVVDAVRMAGNRAVIRAADKAVKEDPPHPAIELYLRGWRDG